MKQSIEITMFINKVDYTNFYFSIKTHRKHTFILYIVFPSAETFTFLWVFWLKSRAARQLLINIPNQLNDKYKQIIL